MFGLDEDGADTHCVNCGSSVYFDVGFSLSICPSCGKNYEKTDEQIEKEERETKEENKKYQTSKFWIEQMIEELDSQIFSLEMTYDAPIRMKIPDTAVKRAKWLKKEIDRLINELKKDL
jgi:DNA-directed RNA polymerase subunit M/transcription elongation factor TFIIS